MTGTLKDIPAHWPTETFDPSVAVPERDRSIARRRLKAVPSPCVDPSLCQHYDQCATEEIACELYYRHVADVGRVSLRRQTAGYPREPSHEWWQRVYEPEGLGEDDWELPL